WLSRRTVRRWRARIRLPRHAARSRPEQLAHRRRDPLRRNSAKSRAEQHRAGPPPAPPLPPPARGAGLARAWAADSRTGNRRGTTPGTTATTPEFAPANPAGLQSTPLLGM